MKKEMESVLDNDKNELWDLAVRVGFLDQMPQSEQVTQCDPVTEASSSHKAEDTFVEESPSKEPYLNQALERVRKEQSKQGVRKEPATANVS